MPLVIESEKKYLRSGKIAAIKAVWNLATDIQKVEEEAENDESLVSPDTLRHFKEDLDNCHNLGIDTDEITADINSLAGAKNWVEARYHFYLILAFRPDGSGLRRGFANYQDAKDFIAGFTVGRIYCGNGIEFHLWNAGKLISITNIRPGVNP